MNYFSRLDTKIQEKKAPLLTMALCGALTLCAPLAKASDSGVELLSVIDETPAVLVHGSSGYLGVTTQDIDPGRAAELHLKDQHGAEVILLDHDAPACKAGIKLHDVIVQMNGQAVDNAEQVHKLLHEVPIGRTVAIVLTRDGQPVTINVQLGDRAKLERSFMNPANETEPEISQTPQTEARPKTQTLVPRSHGPMEFLPGSAGSFTLIPRLDYNPLYVGVGFEPVSPELAGFFGVKSGTGLLVKNVYDDSPASAAGMKYGDVVLNVNGQPMVKLKDWTRAIRINRGKQVQVTLIREHKQQTVTMWAGSPKKG